MMLNPPLTIGMACFDDFDGAYFTVTSLMIHHAEAMNNCNIVVVDNNPTSKHGQALKKWVDSRVPNGQYVPFNGPGGTAQARNEVFRQASGQAVLCIDGHVLLVPGAVQKLIDYYAAHANSRDLLCGPLIRDSGILGATHQRPVWSGGAWGVWSIDERGRDPDAEPFEIWQQGMGLFSCRKEAWVGFHSDFRGFGGCESYVMEKFRRKGGKVLCCPWLRWTHRFHRPAGVPYRIDRGDRLRNYIIGFQELGLDIEPVRRHFNVSNDCTTSIAPPYAQTESCEEFAVVGDDVFGGVRMRGRTLSEHLGCKIMAAAEIPASTRYKTIVAIKRCSNPLEIRRKCDRLVYDPLDVFFNAPPNIDPIEYWRAKHRQLHFDEIIATSPACFEAMRAALPEKVLVHFVPHACDPKIHEGWWNPSGPIVYSGLSRFIESGLDKIETACRMVGKPLIVGRNCEVLKGASLALALRLPPYNTELNRRCKPQIKVENALAAGLPIVSTDCPASVSLHPNIQTVPVEFSAPELARAMHAAMAGRQLQKPYTNAQYLTAMDRIVRRQSIVVYTAIFGGYDQLREPRQRASGVQYICYTDNPNLKSDAWQIRLCQPTGDPWLQAKRFKILAHEALNCDISLWIDGRIGLHDLNGSIEHFNAELSLRRHPQRSCIYAEATHCKRVRRGDPERIDAAVARYASEGHPANYGLWMGGVVLRKHTPSVEAFNREWWRELVAGTSRDQIILPVLLRRHGLSFQTLANDSPRLHIGNHLK